MLIIYFISALVNIGVYIALGLKFADMLTDSLLVRDPRAMQSHKNRWVCVHVITLTYWIGFALLAISKWKPYPVPLY